MTRRRRSTVLALPLVLLVGLTGARITTRDTATVTFDGSTFALQTAAGTDPAWQPAPGDWHLSDQPWTLQLPEDALAAGQTAHVRVAVRNPAPVPASVTLSVADPDPRPDDLFDALRVTLSEDGTTLADGSARDVLVTLPGDLAPDGDQARVIDVLVSLPATGDDRWAGARTGVQLVLAGATR